jgi:epoxyqueuosine reductase
VLLKRLKTLENRLHSQFGPFESRAYVDTGPVVERALATAAGLGWSGKNTCLIHPKLGSFGFLAVLLTSLEAETVATEDLGRLTVPDRCGSCRRCLDACPTGALITPYQMDATRCISYLTIEHRGPIDVDLMAAMGRQIFGCDICQDVCPWNRKAPVSADSELEVREELVNPAGFIGLRRNVAIAMGNGGLSRFVPQLEKWAGAADEALRSAARWALEKLRNSATAL